MKDGIPMEVEVADLLDHPNCIPVLDCFRSLSGEFVVAMPLARDGALQTTQRPEISPNTALQILYDVGSALQYMHSRGIVHRDIKPQNILIIEGRFVLCDYSVSAVLKSEEETISGYTGSPIFMAPEVSPLQYKPRPPDMWSLGVSVYALLYGKYPYNLERGLQQVEQNFVKNVAKSLDLGELQFPEFPFCPPQLKEILARLLDKNPDTRMTADELVSIEWMKTTLSEWKKLHEYIAADR